MSEGLPNKVESPVTEREQRINSVIALIREIAESHESLPFPGIAPEAYAKIKTTEQEFPGYGTSIDDLIKRFETEGMKIVTGKNPRSGNVYVLPAQSNNIETDSISPRQLKIDEATNEKLRELILRII